MSASADRRRRRESLLRRDGNRCRWCGIEFDDETPPTIDHLVQRSRGGNDRMQNLVLACEPCNQQRANTHIAPKGKGHARRTRLDWDPMDDPLRRRKQDA